MIDGSKCATLRALKGTLIVEANSGYRLSFSDPVSYHCFLSSDAEDGALGEAIISALESSKDLTVEEARSIGASDEDWDVWVEKMLVHTRIRTAQKLFQKMAVSNVRERDGIITFSATIKRRGAAWEGRGAEFVTTIRRDESYLSIGQAARKTLTRCIPTVVV